jgi:hypothetical protein
VRRPSRTPWFVSGAAGLVILLSLGILGMRLATRTTHAAPLVVASTAPAATSSSMPSAELASAAPSAPSASTALATTDAPPPAPTASSAPSAAPATPAVPPGRSLLIVTCNPSCDSVWVDGHPAPDVAQGRPMPPGVHQVGANLARHPSKIQPVLLRGGQALRLAVDFTH